MELHVTGRHIHVTDTFREHVDERIAKLVPLVAGERRAEIVVTKDGHHDTHDGVIVVEITLLGKSPVIRAEASDVDKYVAFDRAFTKLYDRIKKANDRRRTGRRRVVAATDLAAVPDLPAVEAASPAPEARLVPDEGPEVVELANTPIEVRVKRHSAEPMTIEQAVYEMEMVGHDFYLFTDAESGLPSVMYRRRGWSYGVLHLDAAGAVPAEVRSA